MAILSTTEELQKHISVSSQFHFPDFEPYILKAVNKYTRRYLGNLHITLANEATEGEQMDILNEGRYYLQEVIANFGMFIYMPLGTVIFDGSGVSNATSENRTQLSGPQLNDIRRTFLTAGHEAMDLLLAFMEYNKVAFPEWAGSDLYTQSKELLIDRAYIFSKYYNIFESRQTYLALQPSLRQVEDQYLFTVFCPELISHLKTGELTQKQQDVKNLLQAAVVSFTVAKVANEGLFLIEATGLRIKYDTLSHEVVQNIDYGKSADFVTNTAKQLGNNGVQYLKKAKQMILDNLSDFNQCASPIITTEAADRWQPYNTKSTLAL